MRYDGLDDVSVPAGGDAQQQAGKEHCRDRCCHHGEVVLSWEVVDAEGGYQCNPLPDEGGEAGKKNEQKPWDKKRSRTSLA